MKQFWNFIRKPSNLGFTIFSVGIVVLVAMILNLGYLLITKDHKWKKCSQHKHKHTKEVVKLCKCVEVIDSVSTKKR